MGLEVGAILTGKVTGIKKFGAFVSLEEGKSGLVHISEVASTYVDDITNHLQQGQEVKVKIIGIDEHGRINLSIKKAQPAERQERTEHTDRPPRRPRAVVAAAPVTAESAFEDKLKQFMQDSSNRISGVEMYASKKGSRRRGR